MSRMESAIRGLQQRDRPEMEWRQRRRRANAPNKGRSLSVHLPPITQDGGPWLSLLEIEDGLYGQPQVQLANAYRGRGRDGS